MAGEGDPSGSDFYLKFSSNAGVWGGELSAEIQPSIDAIHALIDAVEDYDGTIAKSAGTKNPLGRNILSAISEAGDKFETLGKGLVDSLQGAYQIIASIGIDVQELADQLTRISHARGKVLTNASQVTDEDIERAAGTKGQSSAESIRALADINKVFSQEVTKTSRTLERMSRLTETTSSNATQAGDRLKNLNQQLRELFQVASDRGKGLAKLATGIEGSSAAITGNVAADVSGEVQIGNTPANPIPVIIVGAQGIAAGHAHHGSQLPTATTATENANTEAAIVNSGVQRGTRRNPRTVSEDEQLIPGEYFRFPGDSEDVRPRKAYHGITPGETAGQYVNRVEGMQSRERGAYSDIFSALGVNRLSSDEQGQLDKYFRDVGGAPRAVSYGDPALWRHEAGGSVITPPGKSSAAPSGMPPEIKALYERQQHEAALSREVALPFVLDEIRANPHMTQDGLGRSSKEALRQVDDLILGHIGQDRAPRDAQGNVSYAPEEMAQYKQHLSDLFGGSVFDERITPNDVQALREGATRRSYLRDYGSDMAQTNQARQAIFKGQRDIAERDKLSGKSDEWLGDLRNTASTPEFVNAHLASQRLNAQQSRSNIDAYVEKLNRLEDRGGFFTDPQGADPEAKISLEQLDREYKSIINPKLAEIRQDLSRARSNVGRNKQRGRGDLVGKWQERVAGLTGMREDITPQYPGPTPEEELYSSRWGEYRGLQKDLIKDDEKDPMARLSQMDRFRLDQQAIYAHYMADQTPKPPERQIGNAAELENLKTAASNYAALQAERVQAVTEQTLADKVDVPAEEEIPTVGRRRRGKRASQTQAQVESTTTLPAANAKDVQQADVAAARQEYDRVRAQIARAKRTLQEVADAREGQFGSDEQLGGFAAAIEQELAGLQAQAEALRGKAYPTKRSGAASAGGGGGGRKPPKPPTSGSNSEPDGDDEDNSSARPKRVKKVNLQGSAEAMEADLAQVFEQLDAASKRIIAQSRAVLGNPASTAAEREQAIAQAAGALKADSQYENPTLFPGRIGSQGAGAGGRVSRLTDFLGLDTDARQTVQAALRGGPRRQIPEGSRLPSSPGVKDQLNRYADLQADLRAVGASQELTAARVKQFQAEEKLNAVLADEKRTLDQVIAADLQLASASQRVSAITERETAQANPNALQRLTGIRNQTFGQSLARHGLYALENTIGYTLVFSGFEKLREVVHTGIEAQAAFVRLQASLNANGIAAGNLRGQLAQISATTATPLEHVIEAASELAGTFKSAADIQFATNISAQLANISQGTLTAKEAAVGLRDVVAAYGQEWDKLGISVTQGTQQAGDQIAHLSQLTGVGIKDITEGTTQIAQEAHDFGLNQRQAATLAAYITQGTGQGGEQAASQLSRTLSGIYNGKAQSTLVRLGVATPEQFDEGKIADILSSLIDKYSKPVSKGGLNESAKTQIRAIMGTGIQARTFAALSAGGQNLVQELNGSSNDTGALSKQNQQYLDTIAGSIKQLDEDFQNLGSTLQRLHAFDFLGVLAKSMDELLKDFNRVFNGIATLIDSNPITAGLARWSVLILEAAAAWRILGGAATRALVSTGPLRGLTPTNQAEITAAQAAGGAVPRAEYGRVPFRTAVGSLGRSIRGIPAGIYSRIAYGNEDVFANGAVRGPAVRSALAERSRLQTALGRPLPSLNSASTAEANASLRQLGLSARSSAVLISTSAEEQAAAMQASGFSIRAFGAGLAASFAGMAATMGVLALAIVAVTEISKSTSDAKARDAAADRLLKGGTDPKDEAKVGTPLGLRNFAFGDSKSFVGSAFNFAIKNPINLAAAAYNPLNYGRAAGDALHGHFLDAIGDFGNGVFHQSTGPSDESNNRFLALNHQAFDVGVVRNLPKLETPEAVQKWLKAQVKAIEKQKKDIENAGGNDKQARAQISYSISELEANITKAGENRVDAIEGLKNVDNLTYTQLQAAQEALSTFGNLNKSTLQTQIQSIRSILDNTNIANNSTIKGDLRAVANPNATASQELRARQKTDSDLLKKVNNRLSTVGQAGGLSLDSQEYQTDTEVQKSALSDYNTVTDQLLQQPVQAAQNLIQLFQTSGNTTGAIAQMRVQIANLKRISSSKRAGDPDLISTLEQIQQLKLQIAQAAILPDLNRLNLAAANTSDPVKQANLNYQAALLNVKAANKAYEDEYDAEIEAVKAAKKQLDDYLKQWDGHARGSQIAIIQKLEAALSAAEGDVNTTGTNPAKQAADTQKGQSRLSRLQSREQQREAQYAASIAGIRNGPDQVRAQIQGAQLKLQAYGPGGSLANKTAYAQAQTELTQLQLQLKDSLETQAESALSSVAALDTLHGDTVGAAKANLTKAREAYRYAATQYGATSQQARDALAALYQTEGEFYDAQVAQANSVLDLQISQLNARGKQGDAQKAAQLGVQKIKNQINEYLKKGGKKGTDTYNQLQGQLAAAQRTSFDTALQAQLDTLDFQKETYKITSSEEVKALQEILKNKKLTLQEQRDITLKIKSLQEDIRNQLTQGGFNIPTDIKLPTAYEVRRSLGAGFNGSGTTAVQTNTVNNNQQVQVNNNVPTRQVADQIAQQVINLINQQTGSQSRASTSTPRLVPTR